MSIIASPRNEFRDEAFASSLLSLRDDVIDYYKERLSASSSFSRSNKELGIPDDIALLYYFLYWAYPDLSKATEFCMKTKFLDIGWLIKYDDRQRVAFTSSGAGRIRGQRTFEFLSEEYPEIYYVFKIIKRFYDKQGAKESKDERLCMAEKLLAESFFVSKTVRNTLLSQKAKWRDGFRLGNWEDLSFSMREISEEDSDFEMSSNPKYKIVLPVVEVERGPSGLIMSMESVFNYEAEVTKAYCLAMADKRRKVPSKWTGWIGNYGVSQIKEARL
jgi:hypothetical protein